MSSSSSVSVAPVSPPNTLLVAYLHQLATHPLRTKSVTGGTLSFIQEILASHIAGTPSPSVAKDAPFIIHLLARAKVDIKAVKMAVYGAFISAPLGHVLVGALQRHFAGKTDTRSKILQILASNLLVAPVQAAVYLASIAVINGAKSVDQVLKTVKGGFMTVLKVTWMSSPLAMVVAQKFIPPQLWVPFFNFVSFTIGTYFSTRVKMLRMKEEAKRKAGKDEKERKGN